VDDYQSTFDLDAAARLIQKTAGRIHCLTHAKPDGDAFGSVVALVATLRTLDKDVSACFVPPIPASLADMHGAELVNLCLDPAGLQSAELYIILDTGARSQLGPMAQLIDQHPDRTLIIDHHLTGDVAAQYRIIDGDAAACCEIVADLIDRLLADRGGLTAAPRVVANALFVGIASDTGWFRFSSTRPETHQLAARLLRQGVDHAELYRQLEQMERPEKLALLTRALDSLQLFADGRAALMSLRLSDFADTGALEEETERLIDVPQQIGTIQVIALLSEKLDEDETGHKRPITRMSFRSKPGKNAVNVADLAARFGGGGHARAAGARMPAPLDEVAPQVAQALSDLAVVPAAE